MGKEKALKNDKENALKKSEIDLSDIKFKFYKHGNKTCDIRQIECQRILFGELAFLRQPRALMEIATCEMGRRTPEFPETQN